MNPQAIDVRESMRALPGFLQHAITWVTGKPHLGQEPLFRGTWRTQLASALLSLYGGAALGFFAWTHGGLALPLLAPAWLLVAGAARKIQVTLVHQCSHFNFTGHRAWDRRFAQAMSTLVLVDHFDNYFHEHIRVHHTKHLSTAEDPDCAFLLELGFRPGMTVPRLWRRLALTIVSPSFHGKFLRSRFRANFVAAPPARKAAAFAYHGLWLAGVAATGSYGAYLVGWLLPLTLVYHVAALLNFSSLHFWLKPESGESGRARMCSLTAGRFLGDAYPVDGGAAAKSLWALRFAFIHLPLRVGVLSGDLPVHDYHHRYPRCSDWPQFLYMRQRDIERGLPGWEIDYLENWGLAACIGAVFETLSKLPAESLPETAETAAILAQI